VQPRVKIYSDLARLLFDVGIIMNLKNPYRNAELLEPFFFVKIAGIPVFSMQFTLYFVFLSDVVGVGVFAVIFLLTFISGEELKLLRYDDEFKQNFFLVYALTGMYSLLMGWFDFFGAMLLLIVVDVLWSVNIYQVYKKVYCEVNEK
jgi:hypothetical protein